MNGALGKLSRCAIYTRKSTEHNLDLAFNSLDAQREACEAYVKSQAHEGWRLSRDRYDDGGLSGASLDRPALQLLLAGTVAREYRGFSIASVSSRSWLALAYLIVFGSIVAFTAYNWLMEHYSPTFVATHTYINPVVAVLLGWLLAGEAVTLSVLVSAAMVIGAVMLVDRGTARLQRGS